MARARLDDDARLESLLEAVPDAMVAVDPTGAIRFVNRHAEVLFGYDRGGLVGLPIETLVPTALRQVHVGLRSGYLAHPTTRPLGSGLELSGQRRDGIEVPVEISLSPVDTTDGLVVIAAVRDITDRRIYRDRERMASLIENSDDGILSESLDGAITSWNPAAERLYGYTASEALGMAGSALIPPGHGDDVAEIIGLVTRGERVEHYETSRISKEGRLIDVSVSASPIRDPLGNLVGVSTIARDITRRKKAEATIRVLNAELENRVAELRAVNDELQDAQRLLLHRTLHDSLTGLANRILFLDRLEHALADAVRTGCCLAVYFIDLDGFKQVNDTLGHAAGDEVLRAVAARLSDVVRPGDTVARFAGDEFLVLTVGTSGALPVVRATADRLLAALLDPPLGAGGESVTASIGVAVSRDGIEPEQLLREADAAMYQAKRAGRARWEMYGSD
jgi:diguanylate cyclase (GGDEF)-like protein/PAS domain S-box-containing protein